MPGGSGQRSVFIRPRQAMPCPSNSGKAGALFSGASARTAHKAWRRQAKRGKGIGARQTLNVATPVAARAAQSATLSNAPP